MAEPMTDERLAEIRERADSVKTWKAAFAEPIPQIVDADVPALLSEIGRLSEELHRRDLAAEALADQTGFRELAIRDGVLSLDLVPPAELAKRMVLAARHMLGDAENYVEFEFVSRDDPDRFAFTVQRVALGKLTPHKAREAAEAERDRLRDLWQNLAKSMREIHGVHPMNVKDPDRQYCDADNEPWPCPTYRLVMKAVGE